jgi:hypothetical protein
MAVAEGYLSSGIAALFSLMANLPASQNASAFIIRRVD